MHPLSRLIPLLLILLGLAGCALPGSVAINTPADALMKTLGKPTETLANPAGGEFWDYAYGPAGMETWRFGLDGSRTVRSKEQLLTHERLYKVVTGTSTAAQVRELLGKPSQIMNLRMGPVWEWRVNLQPTPGYFFVSFDGKGIAASKGVIMDVALDGDDKGSP
jgi:hypothetical protein